ncbi:FtsX-like permease family protein [Microbispora sp. NPDC046973]|uniref:FtsX-like permease family protein n=1 Tax=Microbispora sp. NPDC046973 TaxID=3155022 RepID=UPI0034022280
MSGLRASLRISRRNARRSKWRSALILAMIGLPVALASFVLSALFGPGPVPDRQHYPLGQADALVTGAREWTGVTQDAWGNRIAEQPGNDPTPFTPAEIAAALAPGSRIVPFAQADFRYLTPQGYDIGWIRQVDLNDPMSRGTFRLTEGRLPAAPGEAVVSADRFGPDTAPDVTLLVGEERRPLRVVGVALFGLTGFPPTLVAFPGSLPDAAFGPVHPELMSRGWLVDSPRPVTWADVRRLNARGLVVVSRTVVEAAPPDEAPSRVRVSSLTQSAPWAAIMLLEVVLLAGPAFAMGRLRRSREFALVAVQGGSPAHLRTIALADGLLFGVAASVLGAALGVGAAWLARPLLEWRAGFLLAPFAAPWAAVTGTAVLGVVAGLLAALAPAVAASRTDPVAVLSGRRERGRERAGRPLLGIVLVVAGTAATIASAGHELGWIATSTLVTQLGLVALTPALIAAVARLAARLPLPLRFAARDAVRNRGRTAPAVAAVMTAVVALTAVGVTWQSRLARNPAYAQSHPQAPAGALWIAGPNLTPGLWDRVRSAVREELPAGVPLVEARTLTSRSGVPVYASVPDTAPDVSRVEWSDPSQSGGLLVGNDDLLRYVLRRDDPGAVAALHEGKAIVLNPVVVRQGQVRIDVSPAVARGESAPLTLPAVGIRATGEGWARAVVAPEVAAKNGYGTATAMLVVDPADLRVPRATAERITAKVERITGKAIVRLEAPEAPDDTFLLVVLGIAAAVLVLGMTFVATMLAAAEARPDLETMSAVGAAPRVKRAVVAGQALVIALLGSVTGVLAGFAPGIAAARQAVPHHAEVFLRPDGVQVTAPADDTSMIAIPWALVGLLVVALPLLAALGGAAFTRSRLPLPRRRTT